MFRRETTFACSTPDLRSAGAVVHNEPLLVPTTHSLRITTAAQRGWAVELFVSEQGRSSCVPRPELLLPFLLEAGVRIFMYPYPVVLHAKHFSVDDHTAVIGSSNMEIRSFNLDFEISMMCTDSRSFVAAMRGSRDMYRRSRR